MLPLTFSAFGKNLCQRLAPQYQHLKLKNRLTQVAQALLVAWTLCQLRCHPRQLRDAAIPLIDLSRSHLHGVGLHSF